MIRKKVFGSEPKSIEPNQWHHQTTYIGRSVPTDKQIQIFLFFRIFIEEFSTSCSVRWRNFWPCVGGVCEWFQKHDGLLIRTVVWHNVHWDLGLYYLHTQTYYYYNDDNDNNNNCYYYYYHYDYRWSPGPDCCNRICVLLESTTCIQTCYYYNDDDNNNCYYNSYNYYYKNILLVLLLLLSLLLVYFYNVP